MTETSDRARFNEQREAERRKREQLDADAFAAFRAWWEAVLRLQLRLRRGQTR